MALWHEKGTRWSRGGDGYQVSHKEEYVSRPWGEEPRIVGFRVRYTSGPLTMQTPIMYEIDAVEFAEKLKCASIECEIRPVWGWEQ